MSFGMRTWSQNGSIELDTDTFTYQVIHSQQYTVDGSNPITVNISGFDPAKCTAVMLPLAPLNSEYPQDAMPYIYQVNGGVIIRPRPNGSNDYGSRITFRLLAMRLKN